MLRSKGSWGTCISQGVSTFLHHASRRTVRLGKRHLDDRNGENGARQAWREAVAAIAEKAKAKLPECNGRVDKAVALVLNGDVELLPDGTAKVASQSTGSTAYHVVNGHCDCRDYEKAPGQLCKHRLSAAIARRAQELTKATLDTASHGQPATSQRSQTLPRRRCQRHR